MLSFVSRVRGAMAFCTLALALVASGFAFGCSGASQREGTMLATAVPAAVAPIPSSAKAYVPGQLIVTLADEGQADATFADAVRRDLLAAGVSAADVLAQPSESAGTVLLVCAPNADCIGKELAQVAHLVAHVRGVQSVHPNYRVSSSIADASSLAEDGDVSQQYYLNGWDDHGANVAKAWGKVGATKKIGVAVLDTGIYVMQDRSASGDLSVGVQGFHQEFDEANLDVAHAIDLVHTGKGSPPRSLVNAENPYGDDNGHGTHVSAIIAANAKTAATPDALPVGMAGVSQNARVIPIKVLDAAGEGDTADFIRAYDYLLGKVRNGELENLHVINMSLSLSFGDDEPDGLDEDITGLEAEGEFGALILDEAEGDESGEDPLEKKIKEAADLGIATVCAAGNEHSAARTYPSDYEACISVTALGRDGKNAPYSNINQYKDISAPGTGIYSAWGSQADAYATLDGTSQAAAIVSGVLSMMWAKDPRLTVDAATSLIYRTAQKVPEANGIDELAASASSGSGPGLRSVNLSKVKNGSHGAIDAAAALELTESNGSGGVAIEDGDVADGDAASAHSAAGGDDTNAGPVDDDGEAGKASDSASASMRGSPGRYYSSENEGEDVAGNAEDDLVSDIAPVAIGGSIALVAAALALFRTAPILLRNERRSTRNKLYPSGESEGGRDVPPDQAYEPDG